MKDVWFYCKVDMKPNRRLSTHYSTNKRGMLLPQLRPSSEWVTVYKDGTTELIGFLDRDGFFDKSLKLDESRKYLCLKAISMWGSGRHVFKIKEYTSNLNECYSPKSALLLSNYKKLKVRIKNNLKE